MSIYEDGTYLSSTGNWHIGDSPWKAEQVRGFLDKNHMQPKTVVEVGCGAGRVLSEVARLRSDGRNGSDDQTTYTGYDVSPQAIELCQEVASGNVVYHCADPLAELEDGDDVDLLMAIDVFEHVSDYLGFLEGCAAKARFKLYHIPLDISVLSALRGTVGKERDRIGHLHYFTAETALDTLRDTNHRIIDSVYTDGSLGLETTSRKRKVANLARRPLGMMSVPFTARLLGGYSLLVLAE
jgi:SAM-dependent methyltransferase